MLRQRFMTTPAAAADRRKLLAFSDTHRHAGIKTSPEGEPMSLKEAAAAVRENAHVPYSNFKVGAALRAASGAVYVGCNVENVAYPEGTCAEAGAIAAMVAAGETQIIEAYVIAGSPMPVTPCGGCRQKLAEFAGPDVLVTMATTDGLEQQTTVGALLPGVFNTAHMSN
ncbi:MAG: cytidine deaminase [Roseobacter sp.]|jgi:cytidine deaminase|nr:cytidine deaminase [Roseobacter sp.]